jgi:hypothetical protein
VDDGVAVSDQPLSSSLECADCEPKGTPTLVIYGWREGVDVVGGLCVASWNYFQWLGVHHSRRLRAPERKVHVNSQTLVFEFRHWSLDFEHSLQIDPVPCDAETRGCWPTSENYVINSSIHRMALAS